MKNDDAKRVEAARLWAQGFPHAGSQYQMALELTGSRAGLPAGVEA